MSSVYHAGEIEVQTLAGVRAMARRMSNSIHDVLPQEAADFLAEQPMVIVSSIGQDGHVWASILMGEPGFARAIDECTVRIEVAPVPGDPLASILADSAENPLDPQDPPTHLDLGLLVIDLETRSRMRLNGRAEVRSDGALWMHTREVYFNCPKYIQARQVTMADSSAAGAAQAAQVTRAEALSPKQSELIAAADTFFVASAAPGGGADASHRGGNPGFVHVRDATTLEWPDYSGNMMFNTLGNITINPNAGLLFLDFTGGGTLQLTGQAKVVWDPQRAASFPGAERIVEFHVQQAIQVAHASPLRFRFLQFSRFNPS
jgi:predicted pyridoxine 5'-phosphate oxidase superfamily flavin-nucleotide-binding protein